MAFLSGHFTIILILNIYVWLYNQDLRRVNLDYWILYEWLRLKYKGT